MPIHQASVFLQKLVKNHTSVNSNTWTDIGMTLDICRWTLFYTVYVNHTYYINRSSESCYCMMDGSCISLQMQTIESVKTTSMEQRSTIKQNKALFQTWT